MFFLKILKMLNRQPQGKLVGVEPIESVVMMEDHNDAYFTWQKMGERNKILLHIDAHIDFSWIDIKEPQQILEEARNIGEVKRMLERAILWERLEGKKDKLVNIGNYIYPAIKDGIVNEVYWVIPGSPNSKIRRKEYKVIRNIFRRLMKKNPQGLKQIEAKDNCLVTELYGKRFTVCHLISDLPQIEEAILLDIDVDFFAIDSILPSTNHLEIKNELPWLLPSQLVDQLRIKKIKTNLVTIAYSVEGGFTPLRYKYLGDELKEILKNPQLEGNFIKTIEHRKQADIRRLEKRGNDAIYEYESLLKLKPDDASGCYNLSLLYLEKGLIDKASLFYQRAIRIDPTYRTAYNNLGKLYEQDGRLEQAKNEYDKLLKLDPEDANAHCGLGSIFSKKRMWDKARVEYEKSIELSGDNFEAHYGIGYVYIREGKWNEAKKEFKKCIELDSLNSGAHYWLGLIYTKKSQHDYAITELNKAVQLGQANDPDVLIRLGLLYLRKRIFDKALEVFKRTIKSLPRFIHSYLQGKRQSVMRFLRRWFRKIERC